MISFREQASWAKISSPMGQASRQKWRHSGAG